MSHTSLTAAAAVAALLVAGPRVGAASTPTHPLAGESVASGLIAAVAPESGPTEAAAAFPPESWKIWFKSRRARRKAYRVTRRSAGKTMGARRAHKAKRRRNRREGVNGVGRQKAKARKARRLRWSRRRH